jgi:hypothetical protein
MSGIAAVAFFLAMVWITAPLAPSGLALQFTFDEETFKAILTGWKPVGVARFRAHFLFDFPFLASYGCFGYLLACRSNLFARYGAAARMRLASLLPVAALLDATENLLHLYLLDVQKAAPALYALAGGVATAKWMLVVVFVGIALAALWRLANYRRRWG